MKCIKIIIKIIVSSAFLFTILVLQLSPLYRAFGEIESRYIWQQIYSSYPDRSNYSSSGDNQNVLIVCTMDSRDRILGFPLPFYKYDGSLSCGNTLISIIALLVNTVLLGAFTWLLIKLLKKF